MLPFSSICVLLLFVAISHPLPLSTNTQTTNVSNLELQSNYFEGDIILNTEQQQKLAYLKNYQKHRPRNGLMDKKYLWPNKVVLYRIASEFSRDQVTIMKMAMSMIASQTCVQFQEAPASAVAYVLIKTNYNRVCNAAVGYQRSVQHVNLHADCVRVGTVMHELLHAIGFYHQQSTFDRDFFVRIRLDNVLEGKEHNFVKYPAGFVSSYGVGYDYDSIMHYGSKAFSRNGLDTIEPLQAESERLGQRQYLSPKDVLKIRKMYGC